MEMEKNWHVNAPWAQLVVSTEMPKKLFQTTLELIFLAFQYLQLTEPKVRLHANFFPFPY
jgi:hypothetical protein